MKSKSLMLLLLLIFVGQVLSAPFKTCTMDNSENSTHSMMMTDMGHHDMSSMSMQTSDPSTMKMDCCGDECQCPVDMCISMVFIDDSSYMSFKTFTNSTVFPNINALQHSFNQDSLYRPPILS